MQERLISALFTFKGLYVFFVIAIVFYGNAHVFGGVTPRHIAAIAMIIAFAKKESHFALNNIICLYLLFILCFGVSSSVTGYSIEYLTFLFSNYMVSLVAYWATRILIIRYNGIGTFLNLFIVLGVLDSLITICQTFGIALGDDLMQWFHLYSSQEFMEELNEERAEDGLSLMMHVMPGAFNNGVANGYFLMTTGVISLKLLIQRFEIIRLIPWLICTLGCICVQERSPIVILIVLSFYVFYKFMVSEEKISKLTFIVSLIAIISSVYKFFFRFGSRIAEVGFEDKGRVGIYNNAMNYYFDHLFIGGFYQFTSEYSTAPHNLILNAFIYGGVIGGFAIVAILFMQFKPIVEFLRGKINGLRRLCFITAIAYIAYTLNSFLHNRSIVTGDVMIWMLWAAFYYSHKISKNDSDENKCIE